MYWQPWVKQVFRADFELRIGKFQGLVALSFPVKFRLHRLLKSISSKKLLINILNHFSKDLVTLPLAKPGLGPRSTSTILSEILSKLRSSSFSLNSSDAVGDTAIVITRLIKSAATCALPRKSKQYSQKQAEAEPSVTVHRHTPNIVLD